MKLVCFFLLLAGSLAGATREGLEAFGAKWGQKLGLEGLRVHLALVDEPALMALSRSEEEIWGYSIYAKGELLVFVLEEQGYAAVEKSIAMKPRTHKARERDQYNTVLHELMHLMLMISKSDEDAEEGVVNQITKLLEKNANRN